MTSKIVVSHTAPIDSSISDLVDWVELKVLESEFNAFNLRELSSLTEEYEDEENEDFSEQDLDNDETVIKVSDEIAYRIKALQAAYPFELTESDSSISLKLGEKNIGEWIYIYCLFISHRKADGVNVSDFVLTNDDRDILQIASVYAAAGDFGDVVSFGYPRPDRSKFLDALKSTFSRMKEGQTRNCFLPGVSPHANDGEVDLIAWQKMNDGLPGKKFLLGQVATGSNWKDKSIVTAIDYVLKTYFSLQPCSRPIPAMFIPFCIDENYSGSRHDVMHNYTYYYGILYYRLRLPFYALRGFQEHEDLPRKNESEKVVSFIRRLLGDKLFDSTFV